MTRTKVVRLGAVLAVLCVYGSNLMAQQAPSKYEVGGEFTYFKLRVANDQRFGLGARLTYNFTDLFALDTEWTVTPANKQVPQSDFAGGRTNEFFAGAKIGGRKPRWGAFMKLRPGFIRTGNVIRTFDDSTFNPVCSCGVPIIIRGPRTDFLLDAGAVVEIYPAKRWILRYDISDMIIFYREGATFINVPPPFPVTTFTVPGGFSSQTFRVSAGISYRFGK